MRPNLLFDHSHYANRDFIRLIVYIGNFTGLGCLMMAAHDQEYEVLVFMMAVVVYKTLITLSPIVAAFFGPTSPRTLHYRAVAVLVLSSCLLITVVFEILNDIVTCFLGQFRPIDSASGFVASRGFRCLYAFAYWLNVISLLGHAIQDMEFWSHNAARLSYISEPDELLAIAEKYNSIPPSPDEPLESP